MRSSTLGMIPYIEKKFPLEFSLELFRRANFCRLFELKVKEAYERKFISIPIYLSIGTEYNAAALSLALQEVRIFAQHRCHSIYLCFGGEPEALRDELLGLPSGCSGGMSGSNAIQGRSIKMFGHSGLMGEQVPIAVGAAMASGKPCLTICGDASVEEDYIYPSLGWAATKKLPVLFICEDNDLSILTKVEVRRSWSPVQVALSMGIPAIDITDNPWLLAYHARKMAENLPGFINVRSVRVLWHAGPGTDGPPEWDRYELTRQTLLEMGLHREIELMNDENRQRVEQLWIDVFRRAR
ncbi:MAG: thiamine pyrophosphate-dependent enzyme [Desulfomonile sp.]|jgi:acetoin:2,6-dichlorophenolindophenol oxidoreductase subunit alpha